MQTCTAKKSNATHHNRPIEIKSSIFSIVTEYFQLGVPFHLQQSNFCNDVSRDPTRMDDFVGSWSICSLCCGVCSQGGHWVFNNGIKLSLLVYLVLFSRYSELCLKICWKSQIFPTTRVFGAALKSTSTEFHQNHWRRKLHGVGCLYRAVLFTSWYVTDTTQTERRTQSHGHNIYRTTLC